ncbi:kinase-like domain-containing protein [Lyophyllum atratum]|nr:kinase-like domain-containing protein [Lyophyllum atratum]
METSDDDCAIVHDDEWCMASNDSHESHAIEQYEKLFFDNDSGAVPTSRTDNLDGITSRHHLDRDLDFHVISSTKPAALSLGSFPSSDHMASTPPDRFEFPELPNSGTWDVPQPNANVRKGFEASEVPQRLWSSKEAASPDLLAKLRSIFQDFSKYRCLLKFRESDAQNLLDTFQYLLDTQRVDDRLRRQLLVALLRLSKASDSYPTCYQLNIVIDNSHTPTNSGNFADIYKGTLKGQAVCLKVARIHQVADRKRLLKAFSREALLWGQLSHPNLLPLYGLSCSREGVGLVSPWMERGDLREHLEHSPEANRLLLARDIAQGLAYLHKNGIVHGDLKGANILIDGTGRACLADFGLSSICDSYIIRETSGSSRWRAPELDDVDNARLVNNDSARDVYACACVCYEIFTGDVTRSEDMTDLKTRFGARPPKPPNTSLSWREWGLTEEIWSLLEYCWNMDPTQRPTSFEFLAWLGPQAIHDDRPRSGESFLPPATLRERMRKPLDLSAIGRTLDRLVALDDPHSSTPQTSTAAQNNETTLQKHGSPGFPKTVIGRTGWMGAIGSVFKNIWR